MLLRNKAVVGILSLVELFVCLNSAQAKPPVVPLMPPREFASAHASQYSFSEKPSHPSVLGIDFGTLGRHEDANTDVAGMQVYWGARVMARFPFLFNDLYIRPSIGYFKRSDKYVAVTASQSVIETGLSLQYALVTSSDFDFFIGLANKIDYAKNSVSVYNLNSTSTDTWRFRMGPSAGFSVHLSRLISWNFDFEYTFSFAKQSRQYGALTTGLAFRID